MFGAKRLEFKYVIPRCLKMGDLGDYEYDIRSAMTSKNSDVKSGYAIV